MAWQLSALNALVHLALAGSLFLAAGCLAVLCYRQPVRRVRLIELTVLGALLLPVAIQVSWLPRWSTGWLRLENSSDLTPVARETEPAPGGVPPASALADAIVPAVANDEKTIAATPITLASPTSVSEVNEKLSEAGPGPLMSLPVVTLALLTYGVATAGFLLWSLYGFAQLLRLSWSASTAEPGLAEQFLRVAGSRGKRVRLLVSDRIELPLTFTGRRPVIVLPKSLCLGKDQAALRYCLAHEWSHVEAGDIRRWYLALAAQILFFYHPLFWWLRRQLRLCQDYLADARAAEQAPEEEDYAEFLVRLARMRLAVPAAALGISDRRSNLYRRITMLLDTRRTLERRCITLWSVAASFAALVLLAASSTVRLDARAATDAGKKEPTNGAAKELPKEKPATKGETLHYTGKVTDKDTGKPIAGAVVTVRRSLYGDPEVKQENQIVQETKHTTDAEGKYSFVIPPEQSSKRYLYIELDVEHHDYAPRSHFGYALGMIRKNEKLGGRPFFESVELRPVKAITGVIKAADGAPVAGVKVLAYSNTDRKG
ncbi:MAG TPA: M56 family metallopeptidase, partial [Gemmataceae bacterium]|nr:M56 family metallopeptidase [Gemmataceae bacterium]